MNLKAFVSRLPSLSRSAKRRREHIRKRLADGSLPPTDGRAYLSRARGEHMCACCRLPILRWSNECDVLEAEQLYAHRGCFAIWVEESRRAAPDAPRAPAPVGGRTSAPAQDAL